MRTRPRGTNGLIKSKTSGNPTYFEYPHGKSSQETNGNTIIYTKHDHKQIAPGQFLNDTIISFFVQYHFDTQVNQELKQRLHVFNSFFFQKIKSVRQNNTSYGHASRWLGSNEIFDKDFLIMPVCEKDHWVLVIVCYPANTRHWNDPNIPDDELFEPAVIILNSCAGLAPAIKKPLSQFLRFQWLKERRSDRTFPINNAKSSGIRLLFPDVPQQKNSSDCGVYILGYLYAFLKGPREAYVKMYRKHNMRRWFHDSGMDISRERRRMLQVVNGQMTSWMEVNKNSTIHLDSESQEVHTASPSSSVDLMENGHESGTNGDASVIVIH